MRNRVTQYRARELRNHAINAEQHLWRFLRRQHLAGYRFRRQVSLCGYITDFACLEAKLVIELDGGQHLDQSRYDRYRDQQMEAAGFRVLRFWDHEVFQETDAVLEDVLRALQSICPPS